MVVDLASHIWEKRHFDCEVRKAPLFGVLLWIQAFAPRREVSVPEPPRIGNLDASSALSAIEAMSCVPQAQWGENSTLW